MQISELWRYPVKSMLGERLEGAEVTAIGVAGDRAYAVIDREDGKVASAKNPRKWRTLLGCTAEFTHEPAPGAPPPPARITLPDGTVVTTDDPELDEVLSRGLGRPVTLASTAPTGSTFEETWPDIEGMAPSEFIDSTRVRTDDGESVSDLALGLAAAPGSFFDLAPMHVVTTSSLDELARRQPASRFVPQRFRPNVVITAPDDGFIENGWVGATLRLGDDASLNVMMPTMRCVMTTLAQGDLPEDRGVLRAATDHNRIEISGLGHWACVGAYAAVLSPGAIRVGDGVDVRP
jgi:uncharacterized protein YcbX